MYITVCQTGNSPADVWRCGAAAHILYYPEEWYTLHIDAPEGGTKMETEKVYAMPFAKIYPMLVDELAKGKVMEKIKRTNK